MWIQKWSVHYLLIWRLQPFAAWFFRSVYTLDHISVPVQSFLSSSEAYWALHIKHTRRTTLHGHETHWRLSQHNSQHELDIHCSTASWTSNPFQLLPKSIIASFCCESILVYSLCTLNHSYRGYWSCSFQTGEQKSPQKPRLVDSLQNPSAILITLPVTLGILSSLQCFLVTLM